MKILIAPDKFKGSLSAREVADHIASGLQDVLAGASIDIVPMADGGEGTAEVICDALNGSWLKCQAHDPLGREIEARYAWIDRGKRAVMEMSEAAGMWRLQPNELDVDVASTFGVGELILDATNRGAKEIIIGLGGSATNDGGFGMARALGFRFRNRNPPAPSDLVRLNRTTSRENHEEEMTGPASRLIELGRIEKPEALDLPGIVAAVDVKNPLLGRNGATSVFGPQKGATSAQIERLEAALTRLADVAAEQWGDDGRDQAGAGAAGGLGFGLMSFCGAKIRPGFAVVADAVDLESKMRDVDLVITGEGSLDRQTLEGKTPAGVAQMARKLEKKVFAVVGRVTEDPAVRGIFDGVYELGGSMPQAPELLRQRARELAAAL